MKKTSTTTVFFDVGGVLLTNGWDHIARQAAAKKFNLDYGEMNDLHGYLVNAFEMGHLDFDQYLDLVVFHQPRDFSKEAFKEFVFEQSKPLPHLLSWVKQWKKETGISIIALNNESKALNDYRIEKFGLHEVFDAFVSSCQIGLRKPDPEIYKLALRIAHAPPENCLYFDDRPFLVQMAKKYGMNAIQHQDFETTKNILENL